MGARTPSPSAVVFAAIAAVAGTAVAQDDPAAGQGESLDAVVVSAGKAPAERAPAALSVTGAHLDARRASTIGETLSQEVGVSSTYFGPNSSRPVIRGLDADRVRITENGSAVVDASSVSPDHASATEPLLAERIDVLRGPDALRYGGGATGGVVNVVDNRIPTAAIDGPGGRAELRFGGAQAERAGAAVIESGNGRVAIHADAYARAAGDARIPGYALTPRQRAIDATTNPAAAAAYGKLPNTFANDQGGAFGAALTAPDGYLGASVSALRSTYGTPASTDTKIDLRKETFDLAGEKRSLPGFVESLRFRLSATDYEHQEKLKDTGAVETTFRSKGLGGRLEATHAALGAVRGSFGLQLGRLDFSALGEEAYVPSTRTDTAALFVLEEWNADRLRLAAGLRAEQTRVDSAGDPAGSGLDRFGPPVSRSFPLVNGSLAATWAMTPAWSLVGQAGLAERAPTHYELFANGPHSATGSWEVGDPTLSKEKSTSLEAGLRFRSDGRRFAVNAYQTRFENYLVLAATGRMRSAGGGVEDPATPGYTPGGEVANLPEYAYRQVPATFRGVEASARWPLPVPGVKLDGEVRFDYVRATDRSSGSPLPRIAPMRAGFALIHQSHGTTVRADLSHAFAQDRTAPNEAPTDPYTLLNLYASYRFREAVSGAWEVFARADNLLNQDARNHASFLKEIAPLPGRSLLVGLRTIF